MKHQDRNPALRRDVEQKIGRRLPKNIEVDHKRPLADGGTNDASNLQLISKKDHQTKTGIENTMRARRRRRLERG